MFDALGVIIHFLFIINIYETINDIVEIGEISDLPLLLVIRSLFITMINMKAEEIDEYDRNRWLNILNSCSVVI